MSIKTAPTISKRTANRRLHGVEPRQPWQHGASGYKNSKCRCEICTTAWNEYYQGYIARRTERGERRTNKGWVKV